MHVPGAATKAGDGSRGAEGAEASARRGANARAHGAARCGPERAGAYCADAAGDGRVGQWPTGRLERG